HCLFNLRSKALSADLANQTIWILAFRQKQEFYMAAIFHCTQGVSKGTFGGIAPCIVSVEAKYHLVDIAKRQSEMFFAACRAHSGDGIVNAILCQSDNIHMAFNHQQALNFAVALAGLIYAVKFTAFVENFGFRRVEVFGFIISQYAPAKAND